MAHTPECIADAQRTRDAQAAFDAQYPNHCGACGGSGATEWSDRDVGIYSALEPCDTCEGAGEGAVCALCGEPGDFSGRTLEMDDGDVRPCGCPTQARRPEFDGPCICEYGLEDLIDTRGADKDQDGVVIEDEDYDFAADDFAFDAAREQAATRAFRGRD
jgi:hypothetical protein